MSRINTNIQALTALVRLGTVADRAALATQRLATGLRINTGRDDPAGLIASETLRRRLTAISTAINNSERANHFISTADSALAEVSSLLLDIKELVHETANNGGLSAAEVEANQQQVDNAIAAIERIAMNTTFGDKHILNGTMAYTLSGVNDTAIPIQSVDVSHALVAESSVVPVTLEVLTQGLQATQSWTVRQAFLDAAEAGSSQIVLTSDQGTNTFTFSGSAITTQDIVDTVNAAQGLTGVEATYVSDTQIDFNSLNWGTDASLTVDAAQPGAAYWRQSNSFLTTVDGEWHLRVASNQGSQVLVFDGPQTVNDVLAAVNAATPTTKVMALYRNNEFAFVSEATGPSASVTVAVEPRIYLNANDSTNTITQYGSSGNQATYTWNTVADFLAVAQADGSSIEVRGLHGTQTFNFGPGVVDGQDIADTIAAASPSTGVTASYAGGAITFTSTDTGSAAFVQLRGLDRPQVDWADQTDFFAEAVDSLNTVRVSGSLGTQTLNFDSAPFTRQDVVDAVNAVQASTGVIAELNGTTIEFKSQRYGPTESVAVYAMHPIPSLTEAIDHTERTGTAHNATTIGGDGAVDIRSINYDPRTKVSADKQIVSLDSANLGIDITLGNYLGQPVGGKGLQGIYPVTTEFYITGGGANFHITPDIDLRGRISNSLPSIMPGNLGNAIVGHLSDLSRGGSKSLLAGLLTESSATVEEAINQIANLRGELGSIQKFIIEPNLKNQRIALENTTAAESAIRDADFAVEMSNLTRAQIITTAAGQALRIANAQPQAMLQLLQ